MSVAATARSRVTEHPALLPAEAAAYFTGMLRRYTDAADVYADLQDGVTDIIVVDVRSPELFAREHIPGAINIPHRTMGPHTHATLPLEPLIVVYCDGIGCNGSTKGAANLAGLGYRVKELLGGLAFWKYDGFPTEGTAQEADPVEVAVAAPATASTDAASPVCGC